MIMCDSDAAARLASLESDNRRLRRLLEKRDAPGELRHRLNSTLALLRIIIKKSAYSKRGLNDYVAHLEDRLEAVVRAQSAADTRGSIDLHTLLADELLYYGSQEGDSVALSGQALQFEPRAGQMFALVIHELAVNSIEHGSIGNGAGTLEVSWTVESASPEPMFTFVWKEHNLGKVTRGSHQGFGSEVLTRTIQYELKARTNLEFEADGLRCTIQFPLSGRVGRIHDE
jgi:two-component sensor histidine kinase